MNVDELKALLLEYDPALKKHHWTGDDEAYTVWTPHDWNTSMTDDFREELMVTVTIDRYTTDPDDKLAWDIYHALEERYVPLGELMPLYDEQSGYYRQIFDCYVFSGHQRKD